MLIILYPLFERYLVNSNQPVGLFHNLQPAVELGAIQMYFSEYGLSLGSK
jgi:hypothetical protein